MSSEWFDPSQDQVRRRCPPTCEVLLLTETVTIGTMRCPPDDPEFGREGVAFVWPSIAFPRFPIGYRHLDGPARGEVVGDACTAVLFNVDRPYRRAALNPAGSCTDWIEVRPDIAAQIAAEVSPAAADRPGEPFDSGCAPCPSGAYLAQRINHLNLKRGLTDALEVEETSLEIVSRLLRARPGGVGPVRRRRPSPSQARFAEEAVSTVRRRLAGSIRAGASLAALSAETHLSPFYLCRLFKRHTGVPIHRYLTRLRLRAALERVAETGDPFAEVAPEFGYATESHFSRAFLGEFGVRPSTLRRSPGRAARTATARRVLEARPDLSGLAG